MIVDLVKVTTTDGVRLDGALRVPAADARLAAEVDACIYVHGVSGNFYSSALWERIAPALLELGIAGLAVNTRGRDLAYTGDVAGRRRRQGAAYEIVDDCRRDLWAWIQFLTIRGYKRIGLIGHSLGALKVVYSQAHEPHEACARIVAVSPPRLSFAAYGAGPLGEPFLAAMAEAQRRVAAGEPEHLQEIEFPFPLLIAASAYIDKYGPGERYDLLRFANRLPCPALFIYGELELKHSGPAFAGLPEALAALPPGAHALEFAHIAGANHFYAAVTEQLAVAVARWLAN
jgi:pimeloyl-ACP methyl ester carboxylesterase